MENRKTIGINMLMSIVLTASNFLFPLITYAYIARVLLPEGTGKVAFVQSVLSYFSYIAMLGIRNYGTRECAKVRDDQEKLSLLVQEILRINLISTAISYILLIITLLFVTKFREYQALFIIMSPSIFLQAIGMEWFYNALEKYTYITIRSVVFKIISVILTFLFIHKSNDYMIYGFITIFATSASYFLNFVNSKKYISYKKREIYNLKKHIQPIMIFFFTTVVISIYGNFDSIMLGFMKGNSEVGIYNSALKMKAIVLSVSTAITSVLIPRMSVYVGQGDDKRFKELLLKSLKVTLVLLLPLSLCVIINASDIIRFICGSEYLAATSTLKILMICTLVLSITNLFGNQILIPKGDEKRYSTSVVIGMFINIGINILLIPGLASFGAAIATLFTECCIAFWMGRGCKNEISFIIKNLRKRTYAVAIVISIIFECIVNCFSASLPLFVRLGVNVICMFLVYYLILLLQKEEILYRVFLKVRRKFRSK